MSYTLSIGDGITGVRQVCVGEFAGVPPEAGTAIFEPGLYAKGLYTYADPEDLTAFVADNLEAGEFCFDIDNRKSHGVFLTEIQAALGGSSTYGAVLEDPDFTESGIVSSAATVTFATAADTITRVGGDFGADGFKIGDTIRIANSVSNNADLTISNVVPTIITVNENVVDEGPVAATVKGITKHTIEVVASTQDADGTRVSFSPPIAILPCQRLRISSSGGNGAVTVYVVKADRGI